MTIYVDIVLIENIIMNYIILFSVGYIAKIKISHIRIIMASLIGAIYAILAYSQVFQAYENIILKIILSMTMVFISYNPKNIIGMIKELILFYLVSFSLGGCAFALLYIVKPQEIFMQNGVYIGTYPIKIILLAGILGFTITYLSFKLVKNKISKKELIYRIEIEIENKKIQTDVILDTGNMLKDPINKNPVILIEKEKLYEILPKYILNSIDKIIGGENEKEYELEYRKRLRIIPFTSVGKQKGIMIGIKADEVKIFTDVDEIINKDAIICPYERKFSKADKYFGLIGLDILERRENNEFIANIKK